MKANFILYVRDQDAATKFYASVLAMEPTLNVPGMTEFTLRKGCVLGLMPEKGIKRLLGEKLPDPEKASGTPRAEVYLSVDDPAAFHDRALRLGARELSPIQERNWGDRAAYFLDADGHVVAFASTVQAAVFDQTDPSPSSPYWQSVLDLDREIFGEKHAAGLAEEVRRKHASTLFVAYRGSEVLGYKLGYERKPRHYYSWLGAVSSQSRGQGIASGLTGAQHDWCRANGYVAIRTQTKNKWREMLSLNIKHGFNVIGSFTDDEGEPKILLEKAFT